MASWICWIFSRFLSSFGKIMTCTYKRCVGMEGVGCEFRYTPGLAMNCTSSPMDPRPQHKSAREYLWAVVHTLGPITAPQQPSSPWTSMCASHRATNRPLITVAQRTHIAVLSVWKESTWVQQYYPSIKWISFLVHFRAVFLHPVTYTIAIDWCTTQHAVIIS